MTPSPPASACPKAERQQPWDLHDLMSDLNATIEGLKADAAQRTEIAGHTTRRNEAQAAVDRLVAERGA